MIFRTWQNTMKNPNYTFLNLYFVCFFSDRHWNPNIYRLLWLKNTRSSNSSHCRGSNNRSLCNFAWRNDYNDSAIIKICFWPSIYELIWIHPNKSSTPFSFLQVLIWSQTIRAWQYNWNIFPGRKMHYYSSHSWHILCPQSLVHAPEFKWICNIYIGSLCSVYESTSIEVGHFRMHSCDILSITLLGRLLYIWRLITKRCFGRLNAVKYTKWRCICQISFIVLTATCPERKRCTLDPGALPLASITTTWKHQRIKVNLNASTQRFETVFKANMLVSRDIKHSQIRIFIGMLFVLAMRNVTCDVNASELD